MSDIRSKINEIYSLEQLASGNTIIHRIHTSAKLIATLVYLVCIMSFGRYTVSQLVPYIFYPVLAISIGEIPWNLILKRSVLALPFCVFAGVSNIIFDRQVAFILGGISVSMGTISFFSIMLKAFLCVSAVLVLVAVTPIRDLSNQLRRMRVPEIFVALIEMTYRYLSVLLEEAVSMYTAYKLRSGGKKGIEMKDMGSFVGQLLIRSMDRAERVYAAMKCRGYAGKDSLGRKESLCERDFVFLAAVCGSSILFRLVNVSVILGGVI